MKRPNHAQAHWLKLIAASSLIVTRAAGKPDSYSLANGTPIPATVADNLIRNGWLRGQRDGLFDEPQNYQVLKPAGSIVDAYRALTGVVVKLPINPATEKEILPANDFLKKPEKTC